MPYYDELFKYLTEHSPHAIASLALKTTDVQVGPKLKTEQVAVNVLHSDLAFQVRVAGEDAVLHIEAQTDDSRHKPMPLRMLAYASLLGLEHELPVYSTVLYFRPNAGRADPGFYAYGGDERGGLRFTYNIIRIYALDGESFLNASSVGLLPFTALMQPPSGMDVETWVQKCVATTREAQVDAEMRATLLFGLSIFGSLAHGADIFTKLISEDIMRESPFYEQVMNRWLEEGKQRGIEQGIEQGSREMAIENTLAVLTERFPFADTASLQPTLEAIADLNCLKQLNLTASLAPSFEAFQYKLQTSENGSDEIT